MVSYIAEAQVPVEALTMFLDDDSLEGTEKSLTGCIRS